MSIRPTILTAIILSLTLACAFDARGQEAQAAPDFPTRPISALSADQAEATELIARSGRPELFRNVTDHQGPAVLHIASGMTCRFVARERGNNLVVYRAETDIEDIGCNTRVDGVYLTHYAYRYPNIGSAEDAFLEAIAAVRQNYPSVRNYEGEVAVASTEDQVLPDIYRARGVIDMNGDELMTKVMVSLAGGWMLKQRMSVPLEQATQGDVWSEFQFVRVVLEVLDHQAAERR